MAYTAMNEFTLFLEDADKTEELGAMLANALEDGMLIFLQGDLGTGKTSLVRGVLRELGYPDAVKSPTYTILEEYSFIGKEVIHFDLYRLTDPEELDLIGIRDYFNNDAICFIEWPDRGKGVLPAEDLVIHMSLKDCGRDARIIAVSDRGREVIEQLYSD